MNYEDIDGSTTSIVKFFSIVIKARDKSEASVYLSITDSPTPLARQHEDSIPPPPEDSATPTNETWGEFWAKTWQEIQAEPWIDDLKAEIGSANYADIFLASLSMITSLTPSRNESRYEIVYSTVLETVTLIRGIWTIGNADFSFGERMHLPR